MELFPKDVLKTTWHREANDLFKIGWFREAIETYTRILDELNPSDTDILSNRSLAYLNVGMYKLAFLDSHAVLQIDPCHQKAIVRKVRSLWGLRKYEAAIKVIQAKISKAQLATPFYKDLELKSLKFLKQSKGEYDMHEMMKLSRNECHEIGEYTGPIDIVSIPGKGRGVIATADISPGQLVMASKAFAISFGMKTCCLRTTALFRTVVEKLKYPDEDVRKEFGKLSACAGPHSPPPTWIWRNTQVPHEEDEMLREVDQRVRDNMFKHSSSRATSHGIWTSASYFNNDCIDANVHVQYFGDVMIVWALNKIPKGHELTINYFLADEPGRREQFRQFRNFECKCRLCEFEEKQSEESQAEYKAALASFKAEVESTRNLQQKRQKLEDGWFDLSEAFESMYLNPALEVYPNSIGTPKTQLGIIMEKFRKIASLRVDNVSLNLAMLDGTVLEFALLLFGNRQFADCFEVLQTARPTLNSAEGIVTHILCADELMVSCYLKIGDFRKITEWIEIYKCDLMRAFGSDKILGVTGKGFLKQLDNIHTVNLHNF